MKIAVITLSNEGTKLLNRLLEKLPGAEGYVNKDVTEPTTAHTFAKVVELTAQIFTQYDGLVYIAPAGAVVRAIAPHIVHKKSDPAVVQMDVGGRWAVSLLSGHEGGANDLAVMVGNVVGADPVISTSTEAVKNIIVGVGCRKGKGADEIAEAVRKGLSLVSIAPEKVRCLASADVKENEQGLIDAARLLQLPLRFISSDEIRKSFREFTHSEFVNDNVNLPAVAEPAALLAGRRTSLLLQKTAFNGITVAVAKESSLSLE